MFTMEHPVIRVKAVKPEFAPKQAHPGEWFDLAVTQTYTLQTGEFAYLDLGVCIELPKGYEAILVPRSSTFKKYRILQTNSIGVIDERYNGDNDWWKFPAYAVEDTIIPEGARIAQFRVQPVQENFYLGMVIKLDNEDRGGLGSTGI